MKTADLDTAPPVPAVGYVRVSTERQARYGKSIPAQKAAIAQYCALAGLDLVDCIEEPGVSAGKKISDRPGLMRVLDMIESRQAEAVVVLKLDRMFRSVVDAADVLDRLKKKKAAFHSVVERWDTSTVWGEAAMQIVTVFSQMERRLAGERTRNVLRSTKKVDPNALPPAASNGVRHRAKHGKLMVGIPPYGYQYATPAIQKALDDGDPALARKLEHLRAQHGELLPREDEQDVIRYIKNSVRRHTKSAKGIATWLNKRGYTTRSGKPWTHVQIGRLMNRHWS